MQQRFSKQAEEGLYTRNVCFVKDIYDTFS